MDWFPLLFLCFQVIAGAASSFIDRSYRTDYVYNKKTDAFYKFHIDGASYDRANKLCALENAKLLSPVNEWDLNQIQSMFKQYPDIDKIWIGDDEEAYTETEENVLVSGSTPQYTKGAEENCDTIDKFGVIKSLEDICHHNSLLKYPFICKVEAKDAPYDEMCGVYDKGYEYNADVRSCYKLPSVPLTWNAAYEECRAVGAHLVVINSETEHLAVANLLQKAPLIPTSHHNLYLSAGFHAKPWTREFVTIFNQTLEEAGYAQWTEYEPNNFNNNEYCGSLYKLDGKLNDFSCTDQYGYICEKEKRFIL